MLHLQNVIIDGLEPCKQNARPDSLEYALSILLKGETPVRVFCPKLQSCFAYWHGATTPARYDYLPQLVRDIRTSTKTGWLYKGSIPLILDINGERFQISYSGYSFIITKIA